MNRKHVLLILIISSYVMWLGYDTVLKISSTSNVYPAYRPIQQQGNKTELKIAIDTESEQPLDSVHFSEGVTNYMIFSRKVKLPTTLKSLKNPCWYEPISQPFSYNGSFYYDDSKCTLPQNKFHQLTEFYSNKTHRLRCYPYFYLAGVQKCGTSDLAAAIAAYHPHIVNSRLKESQFWARRIHGICGSGRNATFADYLDLFDHFAVERQMPRRNIDEMIIGDYTPADFQMLLNWRSIPGNEDLKEPAVTLANILYSINPRTLIITTLRDPVDRVRSNYQHDHYVEQREGHPTPEIFHQSILQQMSDLQKCMEESTLRGCLYDLDSPLGKGIYHIFIKDWIAAFPTEQILYVTLEDRKANKAQVLDVIVDFLGLDPSMSNVMSAESNRIVYKSSNRIEMFPETRQILQDFYRPHNAALDKLLNRTFNWLY